MNTMGVDLEALLKFSGEMEGNSKRIFEDYRKLKDDLGAFSENAMMDIKGEEFRQYIKEQEEWMKELERQFIIYSKFLKEDVAPVVKKHLNLSMK